MSAEDKREARRKRILERGGDRLSRITSTGRGEDYEGLDSTPVKAKKFDDPPDVPIHESFSTGVADKNQGGVMHGNMSSSSTDASVGQQPLAEMFAAMQGRSSSGMDPMATMQQLMNRTSDAADHPHAMPSVSNVSPAVLQRAERLDRRMRLVQTSIVIAFSVFLVFGSIFNESPPGILGRLFPTAAVEAYEHQSYRKQWASLAYHYTPISAWSSVDDPSLLPWGALRSPMDSLRPYLGSALHPSSLPQWPVFWVFATMEIALIGVRIALQQQLPASPPTGLGSVLSLWAPGLVEFVTPLIAVMSLVSSLIDDLCILLFVIGMGVLFCHMA
ncbi:hypothetical protein MYAM1_000243 [Malassezia yamatoensis]|uniref:Uncharacterized protein n=1 Tax=Malassezia yamatoensis TaxID=253288 RepID=A0AAJ6CFB2_9BASI|nr:hypothetical protein MYAM1_000243 [Malassezia yamatoensis]